MTPSLVRICTAFFCLVFSALSQPNTGGSNLISFTQSTGTGVISNYDIAQTQVNTLLTSMYQNGQRRLRLPIFFCHNCDTCTNPNALTRSNYINVSNGDLSPQCKANLQNVLANILAVGFFEVDVALFPAPYTNDDPSTWPVGWAGTTVPYNYPFYYDEYLKLVKNLWPILSAANLNVKLDLMNEGIPPGDQDGNIQGGYGGMLEFCQTLWNDVRVLLNGQTYGFSLIPGREGMVGPVYGGNEPYVFDVHIYGDSYNTFKNSWLALSSHGHGQGWVIGEALNNDATEASELKRAHDELQNTVWFILQWPLDSSLNFTPPTIAYNNYLNFGW